MKAFLLKNLKSISIVAFIIIVFSSLLYAYSSGITGRTMRGPSPGCTCHGPNPTPSVIVVIAAPDTVETSDTVACLLTITGGPLTRAGTNIAVQRGTIEPASTQLQTMTGELTHVAPLTPIGGVAAVSFLYIAPSTTGSDTIYANGNSVNFNSSTSGDAWNFAQNHVITVIPSVGIKKISSVATDYALNQNYPNPFNPVTKISFSVAKKGDVKIVVTDLLGKVVTTLVDENLNSGSYETEFDGSQFSSGVYFYNMITDDFSSVKKMLLVK